MSKRCCRIVPCQVLNTWAGMTETNCRKSKNGKYSSPKQLNDSTAESAETQKDVSFFILAKKLFPLYGEFFGLLGPNRPIAHMMAALSVKS